MERVDEVALECTFRMINAETQLLYASDYPHWDFDLPSTVWDLPFLSEKAKHNILGGTAARLFKLPPRNEKQRGNLEKFGNRLWPDAVPRSRWQRAACMSGEVRPRAIAARSPHPSPARGEGATALLLASSPRWPALRAVARPPARASAVEAFYKGRQINLIVGYGPGGGYDLTARLLARHSRALHAGQSVDRGAEHGRRRQPAGGELPLRRSRRRTAPRSACSAATCR